MSKTFMVIAVVIFNLYLFPSDIILADQWNVGCGGRPARFGYNSSLGPGDTTKLWQGGAYSVIAWQPVIDGDLVAVARCFNLNDVLHGTYIYAYDLHSGTELWSADLPVDFPSTDWRNHVSAIRDSMVYVSRAGNTNATYLYALNAVDGSQLWKSIDLVDESSTEGLTFAPNGDLVMGNFNQIIRINASDGSNVWTVNRNSPTSGGSQVAVFNGKVYGWAAGASGPTVNVYDLSTGIYLYQSNPVGGGYIQQVGLLVGPDGTVYAPRSQNNPSTDYLVAFQDSGGQLIQKWQVELGYVPFSSFAVGPDGSVYSYSRSGEVIRINPDNGLIIDTSQNVQSGISTRMAVDGSGRIWVSSDDTFYSFNPDLSLRWKEYIQGVSGPALGYDGTLALCGRGTDIRAYQGEGNQVNEQPVEIRVNNGNEIQILNNPVNAYAVAVLILTEPHQVKLNIYGSDGRLWGSRELGFLLQGRNETTLDISGLPSGIYIVEMCSSGICLNSDRMIILK
ncbi:MAG: PQQ-binding-like beta-propeller repeat protein [bacterium]